MLNESSEFITLLNETISEFEELPETEVEIYKHKWFNNFVPKDKQEEAINCFCFDKDGYCGYLWHVFSAKILNCVEKDEAKKAFDSFNKQEAILLESIDNVVCKIKDVSKLKAHDLDMFYDIILTAKDFSWTYVKTHETVCGPYFYTND